MARWNLTAEERFWANISSTRNDFDELAASLGVHESTIRNAVRRATWRHVK